MFGFGERKIKINQLPEEKTETKPQSETEQKLTYTEKETENKDNSHDKLLMKLYDISALSVYSYDYQQDFIKPKRIYGIEISRLSIENYLSLKSPTVMRKATGFDDAPLYRARYISKYRADNKEYLVIMSSTRFEGFSIPELINIPVLIKNAISNITG